MSLPRREIDEDERIEALMARRHARRLVQCQCGPDLPGTCPGPASCPYSDFAAEAEDEGECAE